MNKNKQAETRIEFPTETTLVIDGERRVVKAGNLTLRENYLFAPDDDPTDPTERYGQVEIEVVTERVKNE